ncbi:hypothetical protein Swit_1579 [Rhizorhabdus wittichii RW1]|uniref:DUF5681 domain-containing protein n=1 Tax=Rhizorhabdus wittichii (strain DSM 6014 / CCUG 31198 / JCM 15750 / NBRC 105917 / EY 4224 / RW1) TaxID=392499 RepID=A0A9J9HAK1_RHIWR|nr:hypothetical protein Swit_1579 [Rhizorhabdus wittichii RW1]
MTKKYNAKCTPTGDYPLGYCRPPAHSQWKKGQSGNPNGPKPKKVPPYHPSQFIEGTELTKFLLTEEAYRPVSVSQGDTSTELPTIQGVLRVVGREALKGNRFARRDFLNYVMAAERERNEVRHKFNETWFRYKFEGAAAIAEARRKGLPEPELLPHPNDIIADNRTCSVYICGPETEEEKREWDEQLDYLARQQEEVAALAERYRDPANAKYKEMVLEDWHLAQRLFDCVNDNLPPHYRIELQHRSWAEGASRPDDQRYITWPQREYDEERYQAVAAALRRSVPRPES